MNTEGRRSKIIGKRIRERRLELGLSQSALAHELGVSMQAVSLWENGRTMIGSSSLVTLAKKLKCDINWLLNEDVGERQIVDNKNNNDEGTPSIIQFNPFPSESNEADKPLEDAVDFLGRLYRELDKQRRIELLRHAVSMWRESVNETLAKYEKNNDS